MFFLKNVIVLKKISLLLFDPQIRQFELLVNWVFSQRSVALLGSHKDCEIEILVNYVHENIGKCGCDVPVCCIHLFLFIANYFFQDRPALGSWYQFFHHSNWGKNGCPFGLAFYQTRIKISQQTCCRKTKIMKC